MEGQLTMASETPAQQDEHQHKEGIGATLVGFFTEHKALVLGAAIGVGFVLFIVSKSQSNASNTGSTANTANQQGSLAGQQDANTASGLTNLQTQIDNLRNTIGTIAQGPAGPAGGTVPTLNWKPPLIPFGTYTGPSFSNLKAGTKYTYQGIQYTLGAGAGGRLWGTNPQGQQVLLYAPKSAYTPPVLNPLANHSPVYNFMALGQTSSGADLSHPGVAGSAMQRSTVARNGLTWGGGRS
jgi:hypothetical protein